jgi:hypothetical protein
MVGAKIPVLEVENFFFSKDGRGLIVYNDGDNFLLGKNWTGISSNSAGSNKKFFPAASSSGWIAVHVVSGSTYGPTGATYYIPLYSNVNTNLSV